MNKPLTGIAKSIFTLKCLQFPPAYPQTKTLSSVCNINNNLSEKVSPLKCIEEKNHWRQSCTNVYSKNLFGLNSSNCVMLTCHNEKQQSLNGIISIYCLKINLWTVTVVLMIPVFCGSWSLSQQQCFLSLPD